MRMIRKQEYWILYELNALDFERRFFSCKQLFQRQTGQAFLHRILTDDEKWVHSDNPKCHATYGYPSHASLFTARLNVHNPKDHAVKLVRTDGCGTL